MEVPEFKITIWGIAEMICDSVNTNGNLQSCSGYAGDDYCKSCALVREEYFIKCLKEKPELKQKILYEVRRCLDEC